MSGKSKFRIFVLGLGLSTTFCTSFGQAPAANQPAAASASSLPAKVGIVRIQDAIVATNEGKKEFDALQARFAPKESELRSLNDEVEAMKKDLQAKGDKLNEDERLKQTKNLETKEKTLQRNYEDAQNEFQQAQQEVVNRIGGKMLAVLEKYGRDNGYTMILDVSNPQTPVLWARDGTEITKDLVEAYNTQNPSAPSASAAPKTPTGAANRTPASNATGPKKP